MPKDLIIEKNKPLMEAIWQKMPLEHELPAGMRGEFVRYLATDPKFLYETGFIDTKRHKCEEWEGALQDCKQPDGTYLISKEKFIELGKYKYTGPVNKPFDAMKIKEGWYELPEWHRFLIRSVIPSISLPIESLIQAEKHMKVNGQIKKGRILVDKALKLRLKSVLDQFPSPTRRRELAVAEELQKMLDEESARTQSSEPQTLS